jgi:myo-inositol-1-phosphate synthase
MTFDNLSARNSRLAVFMPGMGAVSSTLIAGVEATKRGLAMPIGSYTQMGKLSINNSGTQPVKDLFSLVDLENLVFAGWDIFPDNCYEAALKNHVLDRHLLDQLREPLASISPMPAVFDQRFVPKLNPVISKKAGTKMEYAELLRADIQRFMDENKCDRGVMIWCASTETYNHITRVHEDRQSFEAGLENNDPAISPTQIYAYAALRENIPFINGSPNVSIETPVIQQMACESGVPVAGSDFKTGQTLIKTILAPGLRKRLLGVSGWYSSNILGNRDGEVLDDPDAFRSKEITKTSVLNNIFSPDEYPELYGDLHHMVRIHYYPPRGDNKESWDNIDIFGWLGYPMQIKINFLARDSILAAPVALDLVLLTDLAARVNYTGIQDWLGFYFKSPIAKNGGNIEHDLNIQFNNLESTLNQIHSSLHMMTGKKLVND